jgi:hypothetical protein
MVRLFLEQGYRQVERWLRRQSSFEPRPSKSAVADLNTLKMPKKTAQENCPRKPPKKTTQENHPRRASQTWVGAPLDEG